MRINHKSFLFTIFFVIIYLGFEVTLVKTILIIEDDKAINEMLQELFKNALYEVKSAYSGTEGLLLHGKDVDLIVLDLMLPGKSGEEIIHDLKKIKNVHVIVTSAIHDIGKKLDLFHLGADDYVTKPFNNDELLARIRVHLKHSLSDTDDVIRFEDIELDPRNYKVVCKGVDIPLSKIEFEILKVLMKNSNQVVTKSTLFDTVWDTIDSADENTLNVHMSKIRNKLKKANPNKDYIETIWSIGYKFKN